MVLIISNITRKSIFSRNIFIKHLARSENTDYLCSIKRRFLVTLLSVLFVLDIKDYDSKYLTV